jgi:hypothetical protein
MVISSTDIPSGVNQLACHCLQSKNKVPYSQNLFSSYHTNVKIKLECFVHGMSFQPSPIFAGKARGLHKSGAPARNFTWIGSGFTN